jgi:hypothetical protein
MLTRPDTRFDSVADTRADSPLGESACQSRRRADVDDGVIRRDALLADVKADDPSLTFTPTAHQLRFGAAAANPWLRSVEAMAKAAGVNRVTVWRWSQNPQFVAWLKDKVQRAYGLKYALAIDKALDLAMQGSPEHLKLLMMKFGDWRPAGADGQGNQLRQVSVFINVPRPPREPEDAIDVQPFIRPVPASEKEQ